MQNSRESPDLGARNLDGTPPTRNGRYEHSGGGKYPRSRVVNLFGEDEEAG
jgi:hypothetical protein